MSLPFALLAFVAMTADVPPVPGLCLAPVPTDRDTPGCYKTDEVELIDAPPEIYWHISEFPTLAAANAEAKRHKWVSVTRIHSRNWLYVLSDRSIVQQSGKKRAVVGPLKTAPGIQVAHFAEAVFPPGMRTRVHSHPGPEAFYVVEGSQCMESPTDRQVVQAGGTYIVDSGPHIQAAPRGRRNLVLILVPKGTAALTPGGNWTPSDFCDN